MSEPVGPMTDARFEGLVTVEALPPQGMVTVRGDLGSDALGKAVRAAAGVDVPGPREASVEDGRGALWMSPDELMILCPYAEAGRTVETLQRTLGDSHALVVDVSDARARFRLTGAGLREVIAKVAPVDMAPDAFAPGMLRRTRFAQVAAGFWMQDDETAHVFCFRSVGEYMFNLLKVAAAPGGKVGYF